MGRGGHRSTGPRTLTPLLRDRLAISLRGGGWLRPVALRRLLAVVLVLLAVALALRPGPDTATVLVATRDLVPGSTLTPADVEARPMPAGLIPAGAMTDVSTVDGRVLAGGARHGELITDVRLLGVELSRLLASDGDFATVPVRLSDPDIAELLAPGSTVDVVSVGERSSRPTVLAERATVLTVLDEAAADGLGQAAAHGQRGRLVAVILPRTTATQVAAASLSQSLTVTLR
jgi:pilus assembly protein CpaB